MPNCGGATPRRSSSPADRTRIARALEVLEATGRPLADWHREGLPPLLDASSAVKVFLAPERDELRRRIDARFDAMLARRRARRGARAGGAQARSAAARHEGARRAVADPPPRRRDHARRGRRGRRRTTPAATPSGSSPGRGISCRTGPGWRPRALSPAPCAPSGAEARNDHAKAASVTARPTISTQCAGRGRHLAVEIDREHAPPHHAGRRAVPGGFRDGGQRRAAISASATARRR